MPQLRTKQELANLARAFAMSYKLVEYNNVLYMPVDFITQEPKPTDINKTIWIPLDERTIRGIANLMLNVLFANDGEERSFRLMAKQYSEQRYEVDGILVRIGDDHVELLDEAGQLSPVTGDFTPNYLNIPYDPKSELIEPLFETITEWLGSKEQAESLLHHLATALCPTWSAVKYVLLIGKGRNGKGTLIKLLYGLLGGERNVSGVFRQDMAIKSPIISDLNGKLANIVFDGPRDFLKDSSTEKTLIAGEPVRLKMLYENAPLTVQTNALFVEGLNKEPRLGDKSPAIQKRLVRFRFNNVYELDLDYEDKMKSPEMLAAFFHLLRRYWVNKNEVREKLALTVESMDLQMESVWDTSPLLRFLEDLASRDAKALETLAAGEMWLSPFMTSYRSWLEGNGYKNTEDDFLFNQLKDHFTLDKKTIRVDKRPTTRRYIKSVQPDTMNVINTLLSTAHAEEEALTEEELT